MLISHPRLALAAALFGTLMFHGSAVASECSGIRNDQKRMDCIEKRIDALTSENATLKQRLDELASKVGKIQIPDVDTQVRNALTGVKIEWAAHPNVCLFFHDWTTKPERTPYTVEGCQHDNQMRFNIHK